MPQLRTSGFSSTMRLIMSFMRSGRSRLFSMSGTVFTAATYVSDSTRSIFMRFDSSTRSVNRYAWAYTIAQAMPKIISDTTLITQNSVTMMRHVSRLANVLGYGPLSFFFQSLIPLSAGPRPYFVLLVRLM